MKPQKIELLYADEAIIIVNKPPGILTIPDRHDPAIPNILGYLRDRYESVFTVHRIDRETSGILCFARDEASHRALSMQFQDRLVDKVYMVLVQGTVLGEEGRIENYLADHPTIPGRMVIVKRDGKKSITEWRVTERFRHFTLLDAHIKTGRQHQIRVHFKHLGHPLAIDTMYANKDKLMLSEIKRKFTISENAEEQPIMSRLTLHAHQLGITHPLTGERVHFTAPAPKDFAALLTQLGKWGK